MDKYKQTPLIKAKRFARLEKDPVKKQRILETYEIFYDDNKINNWAMEFNQTIRRKPTKSDFEEYFGRKFPRKSLYRNFDKTLFNLWDSWLELVVCDYLKQCGYSEIYIKDACTDYSQFVRNSMFFVNNKWYQIDIYFPAINFGIEIQDFTTHDKYSDTALYKQRVGCYKHGPTYHNQKINAAIEDGITIVELWEDEIRDKTFKEKIDKWLNQLI